MDTNAMSMIRLLLTRNVALSIRNEKTSYSLMQTRSNTYEKPSAVNKFFMMRKLYTQKLSEGGSVSDHISLLTEIFDQLSNAEMQISNEQMAVILLLSLLESWEAIVSGIINEAGNNDLVFSEVRGLILSEDVRRREIGKSSSSALVIDGRAKNQQHDEKGSRSKSKKRGYRAAIEDGAMNIVRGALVMMRCNRQNNLYYLVGSRMVGRP
ncbi:hypothetical protein MLD38_021081 [Melastoma candidum]|uniref:Uncharacterized protein n=1 Tax=Melastoma candidum TaxID=119954 RepID=A0ACB9QFH5_9MYRT|nr:hypothetical protein MLD38_021081 [Melastoma candidum]